MGGCDFFERFVDSDWGAFVYYGGELESVVLRIVGLGIGDYR